MKKSTARILYFFVAMYFYSFYALKSPLITKLTQMSLSDQSNLFGTINFVSYFSNLLFSLLADKFSIHKKVLIFSLLISFLSFQLFVRTNDIFLCKIFLFSFISLNQILQPMTDTFIFNTNLKYSKIRVFDTLGYIISTFVSGITLNYLKNNFYDGILVLKLVNFTTFLILMALFHLTLKNSQTIQIENLTKSSQKIKFGFLLIIVVLIGINRTSMSNFLPAYYETLNMPNKHSLSYCCLFGVLGELCVFWFDISSYLGYFIAILLGCCFQLARFFCYFFLQKNSNFLLQKIFLIELFKGLTFGMVHSSCAKLASLYGGNNQGLAQTLYNGSYIAMGSLFSGLLIENVFKNTGNDFKVFFKVNIFVCLISIGLVVFMRAIYHKGFC